MDDYQREAMRLERWRQFEQALEDAVESPELYHCPVCLHEWQAPYEDIDSVGQNWKGPWCLACAINGNVVLMGLVEDWDEPPWYTEYIDALNTEPKATQLELKL